MEKRETGIILQKEYPGGKFIIKYGWKEDRWKKPKVNLQKLMKSISKFLDGEEPRWVLRKRIGKFIQQDGHVQVTIHPKGLEPITYALVKRSIPKQPRKQKTKEVGLFDDV